MYDSVTPEPPARFSDPDPRHVCRHWALHAKLSAEKGYPVKCRDARCSLDCLRNWRQKESSVLRRFVAYHLPADTTAYRGHLRLPDHASPADHSAAITKWFRSLKRIGKGDRIEAYAIAHVTSETAQHWDIVIWSDASGRRTRRTVRRAWELAGGKAFSLRPIRTRSERVKSARYTAKDTTVRANPYSHLPARNGVNLCRYSTGFWAGQTKDGLWTECIEAWFGQSKVCGSNKDKQLYDTLPSDPETLEDLRRHRSLTDRTEATIRDKAVRLIADFAPRTPDAAILPTSLSRRVSVHHDWFTRLQSHVPGLCRTEDGKLWVRRPWETADPQSTLIGPDPASIPTGDTSTPTEGGGSAESGEPGV